VRCDERESVGHAHGSMMLEFEHLSVGFDGLFARRITFRSGLAPVERGELLGAAVEDGAVTVSPRRTDSRNKM